MRAVHLKLKIIIYILVRMTELAVIAKIRTETAEDVYNALSEVVYMDWAEKKTMTMHCFL
jgi:hypothetical protein